MANPYTNGNFTPQAQIYDDSEWSALTPQQKQMVQEVKARDGWINGQTPPLGCTINQHGFATASTALVSAVARSINATSSGTVMAPPPLPPPPLRQALNPPASQSNNVPPVINTNATTAGQSFGRSGICVNPNEDGGSVSQVSMVSINGQNYNSAVFDSNGQRLA